MMKYKPVDLTGSKILIVDDQPTTVDILRERLESAGYQIIVAGGGEKAIDLANRIKPDIILLDVVMPGIDGLETCRRLKASEPTQDIAVVFITAHDETERVIAGFRAGGVDYIQKPFEPEEALIRIKTHLTNARLTRALLEEIERRERAEDALQAADEHLEIISAEVAQRWGISGFVAQSPKMVEVFGQIQQLQQNDTTSVLIIGESGTGKELIARAIHYGGPRGNRPFIAVNCGAIPSELAESTFFGHVRGAFTGAERDKPGAFEQASGSTLFLDEIGDMSLDLQVKLFRVLDSGTFTPVGGSREKQVDVRILAATNAELSTKIRNGVFREELYFRLAGFPITVPPLRERKADIPALADHLLLCLATEMGIRKPALSSDALAALKAYHFPGNVREMKNIIERAIIESRGGQIRAEHLHVSDARPLRADRDALTQQMIKGTISYSDALDAFGRYAVERVLSAYGGDRAEAARRMHIHRPNLNRLLKRLNLD